MIQARMGPGFRIIQVVTKTFQSTPLESGFLTEDDNHFTFQVSVQEDMALVFPAGQEGEGKVEARFLGEGKALEILSQRLEREWIVYACKITGPRFFVYRHGEEYGIAETLPSALFWIKARVKV